MAGAVGHQQWREVDDFDAIFFCRRDAAAIGVGDRIAADFRMPRHVEQRIHTTADALASLEHQYFEAVLFERQRRFEARETGADHDDVRFARSGGEGGGAETGERSTRCGGGDEFAT